MRGRKRYALRLQYRGLGRLSSRLRRYYTQSPACGFRLSVSLSVALFAHFPASSPSNDAIICHLTELGGRSGRICASKMWKRAEEKPAPSCCSAAAEGTRSQAADRWRSFSNDFDIQVFLFDRVESIFKEREMFFFFYFNLRVDIENSVN